MDLAGFVRRVKRRTGYGTVSDTSDTATQDIIDAVNDRFAEVWRWWDWDFSLNERTVNLVADTKNYTLETTDGDIVVIDPGVGKDPLKRLTFQEYLKWVRTATTGDPGEVVAYVKIGRDSNDKLKIRVVHTPEEAGTLTVWTKKRLTEYAVADIASNTRLEYFPKEMHGLLADVVSADILDIQGKHDLAELRRERAEAGLNRLVREEENEPDEQVRTHPPTYYRLKKRRRGSGTTVA